ncbi:MAG: amidase [Methylobacteriaceae bacterium]|nr:amidase [Methylobacteriaceae bacterium]
MLPRRARADAPSPYASATELVARLAQGGVSSRELVEAAIARIERLDPRINAVVVRDFDRARAAAEAADAALARGERRPLLGLPMTVKEQFNVAGLPTTWGREKARGWTPPEDALAVQRLKAAGAIILGKTNVPTDLADWQSDNPAYGRTSNPWDLGRTPGGPSGGAAAALAAGFVPLELGSDIGGSLRAPAHFCGICAHKPSLELIPGRGSGPPGSPVRPVAQGDMAVIGPMARQPGDLALALGVLAGPDPRWAGIGYTLVLPKPRRERLGDVKALLLDSHPLCPTDSRIAAALHSLADDLGRAGCTVLRKHPAMPNLAVTTRVYAELLMAIFSADPPPMERAGLLAAAAALGPENQSLAAARLRGFAMSHQAWQATAWLREDLRQRWQALLQDVDVILCPPMPTPAFPHDNAPEDRRVIEIDGKQMPYLDLLAWSGIATLCGLPATVAPIGQADGLPVGVQIIGGYLQDLTTIRIAELLGEAFGGFKPPPLPS